MVGGRRESLESDVHQVSTPGVVPRMGVSTRHPFHGHSDHKGALFVRGPRDAQASEVLVVAPCDFAQLLKKLGCRGDGLHGERLGAYLDLAGKCGVPGCEILIIVHVPRCPILARGMREIVELRIRLVKRDINAF